MLGLVFIDLRFFLIHFLLLLLCMILKRIDRNGNDDKNKSDADNDKISNASLQQTNFCK